MRARKNEQRYAVEMELTVRLHTGPWLVIPASSPEQALQRALERVKKSKLNWWAWQEQDPPAQAKIKKITLVAPPTPNGVHQGGEQSKAAMSLNLPVEMDGKMAGVDTGLDRKRPGNQQ